MAITQGYSKLKVAFIHNLTINITKINIKMLSYSCVESVVNEIDQTLIYSDQQLR